MFVAPARVVRVLRTAAATGFITLVIALAPLPFEAAAAKSHSLPLKGTLSASVPDSDITAPLSAPGRERLCLATAIYFEARGESERGQMAVAEVILARTRTEGRPTTICGVVYEGARHHSGCQFSFACNHKSHATRERKSWDRAKQIAAAALQTHSTIVKGATSFHLASAHPRWALHMVRVCRVGTHIFYRPRQTHAL